MKKQLGHRDALKPLKEKLLKGIDQQNTIYLGILEALGQLGNAGVLDDLTDWLQRGDA